MASLQPTRHSGKGEGAFKNRPPPSPRHTCALAAFRLNVTAPPGLPYRNRKFLISSLAFSPSVMSNTPTLAESPWRLVGNPCSAGRKGGGNLSVGGFKKGVGRVGAAGGGGCQEEEERKGKLQFRQRLLWGFPAGAAAASGREKVGLGVEGERKDLGARRSANGFVGRTERRREGRGRKWKGTPLLSIQPENLLLFKSRVSPPPPLWWERKGARKLVAAEEDRKLESLGK